MYIYIYIYVYVYIYIYTYIYIYRHPIAKVTDTADLNNRYLSLNLSLGPRLVKVLRHLIAKVTDTADNDYDYDMFWNMFQKLMVMHGSPFSTFQREPTNDTSNSQKGNLFIV